MIGSRLRTAVVPAMLFLCLVFGGSSRGIAGPFVLQMLGIGLLAWAGLTRRADQAPSLARPLMILAAFALALVFVQLIPLPPAVWSALPGRAAVAQGYDLLGEPRPWLTLSLSPHETIGVLLFLIPPLAVMAGILVLGAYRRRWLAAAIVAAALLGILLGALQLASGGDPASSPYYLYRITNEHAAVGFFANANHMATLLLVSIPFLAAAVARRLGRSTKRAAPALGIAVPSLLVILLGLALNKSLAGLLLLLPVVIASGVLIVRDRPRVRNWLLAAAGLAGAAALLAVALAPAGPSGNSISVESRREFSARTVEAIGDTMPAGSGFGTFERFYRTYENPGLVDRTYVNHAHNDYLELALEGGLPAVLLLILFLAWWLRRSVAIWRAGSDVYAMAATIASAAMLAHSLVDYPLRTAALAAVFGMCLALMVEPRSRRAVEEEQSPLRATRHLGVG